MCDVVPETAASAGGEWRIAGETVLPWPISPRPRLLQSGEVWRQFCRSGRRLVKRREARQIRPRLPGFAHRSLSNSTIDCLSNHQHC